VNLWIDSICINQSDLGEKSRQIPLMPRIYGAAMLVLVWLGEYSPRFNEAKAGELDSFIKKLVGCLDQLSPVEFLKPEATSQVQNLLRNDGGSDYLAQGARLIASFIDVHSWFTRTWIVQEVSVPFTDPVLHLGQHKFGWTVFSRLCSFLASALKPPGAILDDVTRATHKSLSSAMLIKHTREAYRERLERKEKAGGAIHTDDASIASDLYELLAHNAGHFKCTKPVDRLYGMLGLLCLDLPGPNALRQDYSEPVGHVFRRFAAYLAQSTGDLRILSMSPRLANTEDMCGTPSWTPDWTLVALSAIPPRVKGSVDISEDGTRLHLQGVKIGRVASWHDMAMLEVQRSLGVYGISEDRCAEGDFSEILVELEALIPQVETMFMLHFLAMGNGPADVEDLKRSPFIELEKIKRRAELEYMLMKLRPHGILLTLENGRLVALRHPVDLKITKDVIVCMIKGAYTPSLLLPVKGDDHYRFIGGCEMVGFENPDEAFFAENYLAEVVIV
jgi:hypothetical protein